MGNVDYGYIQIKYYTIIFSIFMKIEYSFYEN